MARVPFTGVQETTPELQAPNDYQHIEASPNDFGAQVGQGLEALSTGALDASKFYGEVAADNGFNNVQTQKQSLFYGDLSKPVLNDDGTPVLGPDGTPVGTGGLYGMRGQDALNAIPQVKQQFEDFVKEQRDSMPTPQARLNFDVVSRRYLNAEEEKMGEFAQQQYRTWGIQTNEKTVALTQNGIASHLYNPDALAQDQETMRAAWVKKYALQYGGGPQIAEAGKLAADQDWAQTQIKASIGSDPKNAQRVLDENKSILASLPNYDAMTRQVQEGVFNGELYPAVTQAVAAATASAQQHVAQPGSPTTTAAPTVGPIYDKIEQVATQNGATPQQIADLKRTAQLESDGRADAQNGASTGVFQLHPSTFKNALPGGTDIHDVGQQVQAELNLADQNRQALGTVSVEPTGANLYIMHQQGAGGGKALLTAPPDTSAVTVLTPIYGGNAATATAAIAGNIGMPYATPAEKAAANDAASKMTAGDFVNHWTQKWNGSAGPQAAPTTADALVLNRPQVLAQAETKAQELFPERADYQERYVAGVERGLDRQIAQTRQQQEVNAHIVQSAMAGDHPPISEEELRAKGDAVSRAYDELAFTNPMARMSIERMFDANGAGANPTYGANAHSYLDRVLAPTGDPNRIADPTGLMNYVGKGADAQITNTGVKSFSDLMTLRNGPQGEALAASARSFFNQMYGNLTFSNPANGLVDQKGEQLYSRFLAQAVPALERAAKAGTTAQILDPTNPDYLGKIATPFMRTPADIIGERLKAEGREGVLTEFSKLQTLPDLKAAVVNGSLTADEATWIASRRGLKAPPPPALKPGADASHGLRAPLPTVSAPAGDE